MSTLEISEKSLEVKESSTSPLLSCFASHGVTARNHRQNWKIQVGETLSAILGLSSAILCAKCHRVDDVTLGRDQSIGHQSHLIRKTSIKESFEI
jgi:hypothetical protein